MSNYNTTGLLDCGHAPSPHHSFTTGYGTMKDGTKHCYECCAEMDRAEMVKTGRATMYLTQEQTLGRIHTEQGRGHATVTNWPGSLRFTAYVRKGRHNIAGVRYDVWFAGPDGHKWHGVTYGDNTQICRCKRTKN